MELTSPTKYEKEKGCLWSSECNNKARNYGKLGEILFGGVNNVERQCNKEEDRQRWTLMHQTAAIDSAQEWKWTLDAHLMDV